MFLSFWDIFCFLGLCHAFTLLLYFVLSPFRVDAWERNADGEGSAEHGVVQLGFIWEHYLHAALDLRLERGGDEQNRHLKM